MNNEQHDDIAKSITGGTFFAVLLIFIFLCCYTVLHL